MAGQKRKFPRRWTEGFTLIELTVALAIVAVVTTAVFSLQDQGFRSFLRTSQVTSAVLLAQDLLSDAQLSSPASGRGRIKTSTGEELLWRRSVSRTAFPGVFAVQIQILLPKTSNPLLDVTTYVANP